MVTGTSNRANSWLEASCDLSGRKRVLVYSNREDSDSRRAAMRWAIVTVWRTEIAPSLELKNMVWNDE